MCYFRAWGKGVDVLKEMKNRREYYVTEDKGKVTKNLGWRKEVVI
jgi:hypothetical protein